MGNSFAFFNLLEAFFDLLNKYQAFYQLLQVKLFGEFIYRLQCFVPFHLILALGKYNAFSAKMVLRKAAALG
jgi:hypothetical protein